MFNRYILPISLSIATGIFAASRNNIEHIHNAKTDNKGNFSCKTLAEYLNRSKQLKGYSKHFGSIKESQIRHMSQEAQDARWGTAQLFKYTTYHGKSYIIKEINASAGNGPINEIERLQKAARSNHITKCVYPKRKTGYPQFIFPIAYHSYTHKNKTRYIVIMPAAHGTDLMSYLKGFKTGYRKNNSAYLQNAAKAFFHVGRKMARFYEYHRKKRSDNSAILHGDFHMGNIFINHQDNQVTLIDNERVSNSFNECKSRAEDIAFLTLKSMFVVKWNNGSIFNHPFSKHGWYDLFLPTFIAGYLSIYDQKNRFLEYKKLKNWIQSFKDINNGCHWYTDKSILEFSHKQYMNPVFNRIENSKLFFSINTTSATKHFKGGRTLLHDAAKNNGETICIWPLIAAGAHVYAQDNDQNIPLHEAAWSNKEEAIKRLLYAGSSKNAKDRNGSTPLDKAEYNNSYKAIEMLQKL